MFLYKHCFVCTQDCDFRYFFQLSLNEQESKSFDNDARTFFARLI